MLQKFIRGKVAVFIDAANIELSAKDLNFRIDYKKLYNWLKKEVRFETKNHDGFLTVLKKTGYHLVTKPLKIIKAKRDGTHLRKANFDVEIAVETIKRINDFDTFLLFSGDSDFHYLVKELKKNNKKIIIASLKYHVAKELIESADYYLDLRRIKDKIKR